MNQFKRMNQKVTSRLPQVSLLALAIAGLASPIHAATFELGDFRMQVDSQISVGASFRVDSRNDDYVAAGTLNAQGDRYRGGSPTGSTPLPLGNPSYQGQQTNNTDDGNQNFDRGDAFSQVISGNHQFSITHSQHRNFGANLGFRYWYDRALDRLDGPTEGGQANNWRGSTAFNDARGGIELQDAYLWGEFDVMDRPAQILLGRHVLNWGESTFIQGGQNAANPIDVPALRRPGAEIRDGLLPVNMISGSITLDEAGALTLEGYYQFDWQRTRADACGSFFSNNDFASEGCGPVYLNSAVGESAIVDLGLPGEGIFVANPLADNTPSSSGQFGIALKWYAEQLNGTEFGISYQNVHSRLPYVSGYVPEQNGQAGGRVDYVVEFPEDMQIIAASFATLLPTGTAWSGELTYRPDTPIQINANDILVRGGAALAGANQNCNTALATGPAHPAFALCATLPSDVRDLGPGYQQGYREFDVFQFQSTFIHDFNQVLGANNLRMIGEIGFTYVDGLPDTNQMRFGRSSIYGSFGEQVAIGNVATELGKAAQGISSSVFADNGYVTDFSWGYRLVAQLEYNNAFIGGLTLKPTFSWSHDVNGYGPEPGAQFYEGRMILGTELAAEYMNTYWGRLGYTHYFDTDYWDLDDRSFISLSVGMNY